MERRFEPGANLHWMNQNVLWRIESDAVAHQSASLRLRRNLIGSPEAAVGEGIDMHHPAEELRHEPPASELAYGVKHYSNTVACLPFFCSVSTWILVGPIRE